MEKIRKEKMQAREKVGKSRTLYVPMFCGSAGSRSRLAKAAGAWPAGQIKDENMHAVVAQTTFGSKQCQNTSVSDNFWKLGCRKSACGCDAKHIWKSI